MRAATAPNLGVVTSPLGGHLVDLTDLAHESRQSARALYLALGNVVEEGATAEDLDAVRWLAGEVLRHAEATATKADEVTSTAA